MFASTSVTKPSSVSAFSSMREKTRCAPAPAMTMELICWESWLILPVNCLVMLRNGTRIEISSALPERLRFGTPISSSTPPTSARAT